MTGTNHHDDRLLWTLGLALGLHALLLWIPLPPPSSPPALPPPLLIELAPAPDAPDPIPELAPGALPEALPDPPAASIAPAAPAPVPPPAPAPPRPAPAPPPLSAAAPPPEPEGASLAPPPDAPPPGDAPPSEIPPDLATRLFPQPAMERQRALLLGRGGTGPVTGEALEERVQGLAALDAQVILAQNREAMGLNHPRVKELSDALKAAFQPTLPEIRGAGITPQVKREHGLPEHMEKQLAMIAENGGIQGGSVQSSLAAAGLQASACDYGYYELGWLSLRMDPGGALLGAAIYKSSGSPSMDRRLLAMAETLSPYGDIPADALAADGSFRGTWEFGFRDYAVGSCVVRSKDGGPLRMVTIRFRGSFF